MVVVLVAAAAEVSVEAVASVALAELLISEAVLEGFTRRVRAELRALERVVEESDLEPGGTHHICQRPRRRFAPPPPGDL